MYSLHVKLRVRVRLLHVRVCTYRYVCAESESIIRRTGDFIT